VTQVVSINQADLLMYYILLVPASKDIQCIEQQNDILMRD